MPLLFQRSIGGETGRITPNAIRNLLISALAAHRPDCGPPASPCTSPRMTFAGSS